ncbi:MAG: NTP transferase domain-containing protein [Elusimicrobia bacterium]|nr:NTP transferase domain-containing protein [Elusimicrobiota bacterium]
MSPAQTDAIVLCGGLGTRLGAAAGDAPKPMALVGGKPFLDILVEWAAAAGARRFIFCTGYKAGVVRAHFKPRAGREYLFSEEKEPLGTGGALKLCEGLRKSETALVLNGDSYCAVDLKAFLEFHDERRGAATVALAQAGGRTDGGFVSLNDDGRITTFAEKDPKGGSWLNAGLLALGPRVFAALPAAGPCSLEREILPALLKEGLYGFTTSAPLYDIGTPERLERFRGAYAGPA